MGRPPPGAILIIVLALVGVASAIGWAQQAPPETVKQWADRLGKSLSDLGRKVTREAEIKRMYKQLGALVVRRDGEELMTEIRKSIEEMVSEKMAAVQCLMQTAEEVSFTPSDFADELENVDFDDGLFTYASSKFSPIGSEIQYPQPTPPPPANYTTGIAHYRKPVPPIWYRPIELGPDPHFHNIPINDTFSTVHVPTNVYDRAPDVIEAITWSEQLDRVFAANYKADPSLTWQYFGSARGFMRQYPGIQWKSGGVDLYDCRTQPWYISAVTCSKDVVLLVDASGSMTGMRFSIARLVTHSLLDTLTSNDFVSIIAFSESITHPVPCFENMLVQATKENIQVLKQKLSQVTTEGYGNFTAAFATAFQLLERYRESRDCENYGCNQAIMLITDGVPGNLTETFDTYNRFNDTGEMNIPVRVFTYLLGKEVTNVREIQWMACLNRGYYTHMQSLEEVREEALRYLNVIARPLVLQGTEHPIVWTHAYADFQDSKVNVWLREVMQANMARNNRLGYTQLEEDKLFIKGLYTEESMPRKVQQFQLMTSVSIPVFDKHGNDRNNETRTAEVLGVAGLDVPLLYFRRLTKPHKIGANGYAFVITNNGYILMHPELRPVVQGHPRDNFNSVDLTEIELEDDESEEPRDLNPEMLQLRKSMVEHITGSSKNHKMKFAYDDMRRVGVEERDFYFAPINGTPFTLGLALSPNYGRFTLGLGEKFRKIERAGITAKNYFHGNNWKIHPEWLYCRHYHDSLNVFNTPEERLLHFLGRRDQSENWKWQSEKPKPSEGDEYIDSCGRPPVPEDAYFCDQELMEKLMMEAKALNSWYGTDTWDLRDKKEREAVQEFNVTMRFVATHSGLTRWQHVMVDNGEQESFGEWNSRTSDEDWYRAAVLLHEESPDSFLFTVPFESGSNPDAPVTGHSAIYHQDGGFEVPVSVVGFQVPLSQVQRHLQVITAAISSEECQNSTSLEACGCISEDLSCYLLDSHGYVVVSEELNDTGRFFGDVAPDAMVSLHELGVYRKITLFDYQALCVWEIQVHSGAAELLMTPLRWLQWMFGWIVGQFMQLAVNDFLFRPLHAAEDVFYDEEYDLPSIPGTPVIDVPAGEVPKSSQVPLIKVGADPCDKKRQLALLQLTIRDEPRIYLAPAPPQLPLEPPTANNVTEMQADEPSNDVIPPESKEDIENTIEEIEVTEPKLESEEEEAETTEPEPTEAPFVFVGRSLIAQRVIHTNLVLVIIDGLSAEGEAGPDRWSATAERLDYMNSTHPCYKLPLNDLPRRRLEGCLSSHPLESEIEQCGRGVLAAAPRVLIMFMLLLVTITRVINLH